MTRANARLLGPCFKTGRIGDRLSYRDGTYGSTHTAVQRTTPSGTPPTPTAALRHTPNAKARSTTATQQSSTSRHDKTPTPKDWATSHRSEETTEPLGTY